MKLFNRALKQSRKSVQKGFTLIELAIVGLFLGLLAVFAISQFSGSATDSTRANGLGESAQKIADNWALVSQACGVDSNVTTLNMVTNAATGAAAGNLSMLLGNSAPNAAFTNCFNQSGVRPLNNLTQGAAGSEAIYGYTVTLGNTTVNGRNAMTVAFANVPENVFLALYNKLSSVSGAASATSVPAATTDTTDPAIRFSANASGRRTITLVRAL